MAKTERIQNMTKGSPAKLIFTFAIPLMLGNVFQQFYTVVDTAIVGQALGVNALAALGAADWLNWLVLGLIQGFAQGFSIYMAQRFGAEDHEGLNRSIGATISLSAVISILTVILSQVAMAPVLRAMNTPEEIIGGAFTYLRIMFAGIPIIMAYNVLASILRALGDSKTPLFFLVLSSVLNVILDLAFILIFKLGVFGASLATVLSQAISGVLCLLFIMVKVPILHITRSEWRPQSKRMTELCTYGVPMGLQYSITAIGSVILQVAVNSLGSLSVAAVTAASKVLNFLACPFDALGSTMATYGAQNVGASRYDRLNKGIYSASLMGFGYSLLAFGVAWFFGRSLTGLFVSGDSSAQLVELAQTYMITNVLAYPLLTLVNVVRFMIQGMGFSMFAILAGVMEMAARSLEGMFLVPALGYFGAALGSPLAWVAADLFLVPAYFRCRRVLMSQSHHLHVMGERAELN